jgi:hypothetical protein
MLILLKVLQTVLLVLPIVLLLQLVTVKTGIITFQLELMKKVLLNVINVPTDVLLVKTMPITV